MQAKKKVLYVFGGEKAQGAEIVIERLMDYISHDFELHLILSPGDFATSLVNKAKPYKITQLNNLRKLNRTGGGKARYYLKAISNYLTVSRAVYTYIKQHDIELVHANTMVAASYLIPALKVCRQFKPAIKWIWSDHDMRYFSGLDIRLSKLCAASYDKTLVVSQVLTKKYPGNARVQVLYNGLDPQKFKHDDHLRQEFRKQHNLQDDSIVIGLAAKITPSKGQLELAQVVAQLSEKYNIKLLLAGAYPPETPEYNSQVQQAVASSPAIEYAGFIQNVEVFFNGCDIIVNNSDNYRSEPLGTTIYEAMACEKVVVASRTGGTPEIITDGVDGFIFEPESKEDLMEKLNHVLANFYQLENVKKAAREKVLSRFTINRMAERYLQILQTL